MTRVFLAAGVAALAIAAPAAAGPHGGGRGGQAAFATHGGGGGGGAAPKAQRQQRQAVAAPRAQRQQRQAMAAPRVQRQQRFAAIERPQRAQRQQMRAERQQARPQRMERAQTRMAARQQVRAGHQQAQARVAERQQVRANRIQQAHNQRPMRVQQAQQQQRLGHQQQVQARMAQRQQLRANRQQQVQAQIAQRQDLRADRRMAMNARIAHQQELQVLRSADPRVFQQSRIQMLAPRTRIIGPAQVVQYVGQPVSTVNNYVPLAALPASLGYLYPSTPNYYYQYGGGYLYQVDRSTSLIDALIPLLAGGYMPGTYLPSSYMNSYVPNYYGLNSFYPSSYGSGYGYGYDNLCNRYANGVVYQVDCMTGMVENVIPTYAGGYGVGQMLPSAYNYYNVPMQYRSMYYPTSDYSYWYAPGAIYQYDPSSSLITSVAALMSPGFSVGQPLPMGYDMYNVPMSYRSTYYDTPNAWYRYNNGYIYQVDPTTQLVTAIVASLLT